MMYKGFVKKFIVSLSMAFLTFNCISCGNSDASKAADQIVNGDFESEHGTNEWIGWTKSDAAFNVRGVVDSDKIHGVTIEKDGNFFFSGSDGGNQAMRGTLTSDTFKLSGNGYITFKMGAGKNTDKVYVEFFEEGKDTPILRITNPECDGIYITDHLITKIADLTAYVGKNIYIKVTDNDDGNDYSYINLDSFHMCSTDDEINSARTEYDRQIAEYGEKPFEEDETATSIINGDFETGDLSGWKILDGTALSIAGLIPTSQRYWTDRSVYGHGNFYLDGNNNGSISESLTGSIRSTKFTLAGDGYISFMIGAASRNCYVAICDANTDEELIVVNNEYFSDPTFALTLLRVYVDASEYIGKVLYIKVTDNNDGSGFAFINVDDFRVSLTEAEVAALELEQFTEIQNETYTSAAYNDLTSLLSYYGSYPYPVPLESIVFTGFIANKTSFLGTVDLTSYLTDASATFGNKTVTDISITSVDFNGKTYTDGFKLFTFSEPGYYNVTYTAVYGGSSASKSFTIVVRENDSTIANGGFESGNLAGWEVLTDGWNTVDGQPSGVISATSYWGEGLPYNQAGNYHLDGWNTGIDEGNTWALRSTTFKLSGSGYISVRMGGHAAAVRVFLENGTEIGYYTQNRFNDQNFPSLAAGGSWADMGTYVIDLSDYINQTLYIELCDDNVNGWAQAFFDEVVTYYKEVPDFENCSDIVADGGTGEEVAIKWQLAPNKH